MEIENKPAKFISGVCPANNKTVMFSNTVFSSRQSSGQMEGLNETQKEALNFCYALNLNGTNNSSESETKQKETTDDGGVLSGEILKMLREVITGSDTGIRKLSDDYKEMLYFNSQRLKKHILQNLASQVTLNTKQPFDDQITGALDFACFDHIMSNLVEKR
jgi:hypothetical protein